MNKFRQRVPNWCDADGHSFPFETLEDLLTNEVVRYWSKQPEFIEYRMSDDMLMAVMIGESYPVGYIENYDAINLPKWESPKNIESSLNKFFDDEIENGLIDVNLYLVKNGSQNSLLSELHDLMTSPVINDAEFF